MLEWWQKTGKQLYVPKKEKPSTRTTYKFDGSVKTKEIFHFEQHQVVSIEVYDASDNMEFIEIPIYDRDDLQAGKKRLTPDGKPWPFHFPVYGAASLGGLAKIQAEIEQIEVAVAQIKSETPILEVLFLDANRAEVTTGANGRGEYYDFRKEEGKWKRLNENGFRGWGSITH